MNDFLNIWDFEMKPTAIQYAEALHIVTYPHSYRPSLVALAERFCAQWGVK